MLLGRLKGGLGSGHYGHKGIIGHQGGSLPRGILSSEAQKISLKASDGYPEELISYLYKRQRELARKGSFANQPEDEAMYHLGFRLRKGQGTEEDFALAEYVEKRTDRETMLKVLGTQGMWFMSPSAAVDEWTAAAKLCSNINLPKEIKISEMSDIMLEGYKARMEFMQESFKQKYGESFDVFRGVHGRQGTKISDLLVHDKNAVLDLDVRTLSSFTRHAGNAQLFAKRSGAVLKTTISYKDVWFFNEIGVHTPIRFSDDYGEVVLINPVSKRKVTGW